LPLVPQPLLKTRTQNGALLALRSATVLGLRWNSPPRILVVARHADGDRATPTASRTALTLCPRTAVILRQRQCSRGKRRWSSEGGRQRVSLRASPLLTRGKSSWKGKTKRGWSSEGDSRGWHQREPHTSCCSMAKQAKEEARRRVSREGGRELGRELREGKSLGKGTVVDRRRNVSEIKFLYAVHI